MRAYERFLKYAKIHTQSSEDTGVTPSTPVQWDLARVLEQELRDLGVQDVKLDEQWCIVTGRIPATPGMEHVPALGFLAHMDTAPAFSGENVNPILHENYDGGDVVLPQEGRVIRASEFPFLAELKGKTLGIQAYGNVGRLVAAHAKSFGMKIMAFDPFVPADKIQAEGVEVAASLEDLYAKSDFVSLHIPANNETKGSIGYALLSKMPKGGCLVNTARKEVINEPELVKVLEERQDLKYITDIAAGNQAELNEKFGKRVFATPKKMGAETAEANVNAGVAAANQICDFFATGNRKFQVNK